ncbi:MAG TPA: N-formylglutamate amidohydrolase [Asticcacaulis sp.]|nr:N-formylglutamate amidohydrolase [Asticcacaulis sp.]
MQANPQITDEMPLFDSHEGLGPLVVAAPHVGIHLPPDIAARMNATGLSVGETDYHVHRLFDFAPALGGSTLFATHSRYVADLNRAPDGQFLYPGKFETPICPECDFDRNPIYREATPLSAEDVGLRRELYWQPYHDQLRSLLDRAVARHGFAMLIDAHSIRPSIPSLFEGRLPDLNFGLNNGQSAAAGVADVVRDWGARQNRYSYIIDGRFKGGYTTRHYGQPDRRMHALQIEIVQDTYLNMAAPHLYDAGLAAPLSHALRPLVEALLEALPRL